MTDLSKKIETLKKEAEEKSKEIERWEKIYKKYPNARIITGRWNYIAVSDESVNNKVDEVYIRHNCGCCDDSPLEAWPYYYDEELNQNIYFLNKITIPESSRVVKDLKTKTEKVLVTPEKIIYNSHFSVGERCYDGGDRPYENWEKTLNNVNMPPIIIDKIKDYFENNKPQLDYEESELEEDKEDF